MATGVIRELASITKTDSDLHVMNAIWLCMQAVTSLSGLIRRVGFLG